MQQFMGLYRTIFAQFVSYARVHLLSTSHFRSHALHRNCLHDSALECLEPNFLFLSTVKRGMIWVQLQWQLGGF
jgi:hypothetical protein